MFRKIWPKSWWLGLFLLAHGCVVAPLSNHITARTNGEGDSLASIGSTIGVDRNAWVPSLKYSVGLSSDVDIGFQYEVVEWGAFVKYAFLNQLDEGLAVAGVAGSGLSFEGFYGYLGPIVSYKTGSFEPYFITRFNYVRSEPPKTELGSIGEIDVRPGTYRYFQHSLGFLVWPLHWFGAGLEGSMFTTVRSPFVLRDHNRFLVSGNFSFRF